MRRDRVGKRRGPKDAGAGVQAYPRARASFFLTFPLLAGLTVALLPPAAFGQTSRVEDGRAQAGADGGGAGVTWPADVGVGTWAITAGGGVLVIAIGGGAVLRRQVRARTVALETAARRSRDSEALLRAVMDNAPFFLALKDAEGRFQMVNENARAVRGWGPDEALGKTAHELFPKAVADLIDANDRKARETRRPVQSEYEIVTPQGPRIYRETKFPIVGNGNGVTGVGVIAGDVTEQKQAEQKLRASDARFRAVLDQLPSAVHVKDLEGRYLFVNERFQQWFNPRRDPLVGKTVHDFFPREFADDIARQHQSVIDGGPLMGKEMVIPFPDGTWRAAIVDRYAILEEDGLPRAVCTIITDVSERKAAEAQLLQAQKMEAVGQLTGGIAHDFNNLLAVILGNLQLMERRLGDDERLRHMARAAIDATMRGADLTKRLLAFSRRQDLETKVMSVNALVAGMDALLRRTLGETIHIETTLAPDLWQTTVDPAQLESALLNLAVNARDAMPDGGKLIIETANVELDEHYAQRNGIASGPYVKVGVTDTGTGMPPEVTAHAFEPFFTTKEPGKGTGLGLATTYGFVKQIGGHIKIYSEVGLGTTINIYLRRADADAVDSIAPSDHERSELRARGGEAVLVVEDDAAVRATTVAMLRDLGYRVAEAEDGPAALALLDDGLQYDLLFTDMVMSGGMSGPELAVCAAELKPAIRILFTSGYPRDALRQLGTDAVVIRKPYRREDLAEQVRAMLDR